MKSLRERAADGLHVGDTFSLARCFTTQDIREFARVSRDYNPVHFDDEFAALHHFSAPVSQGLLTASLLTEIGGQIGWLATAMSLRFKRPVYAGDTVTCHWKITTIDERGRGTAVITMLNGDGVMVLEAETQGVLPGLQEQQRLRSMLAEGDPTNPLGEPAQN